MSTESIKRSINIDSEEAAERFVNALEEAEKKRGEINITGMKQASGKSYVSTKRVVLELPQMPISCVDCPLRTYESYEYLKEYGLYCCAERQRKKCPSEGRREDCPLTEVEF